MIPPTDHPVWTRIVTGKVPVQTSKLAINLLVHNNKMDYERDPSPANVKLLIRRTHQFFCQYELAFGAELAKILR